MKRFEAIAGIAFATVVLAAAAGVLADTPSGAAQTTRTIGLIVEGPGSPIAPQLENGGQSAASALGDTLAVSETNAVPKEVNAMEFLISQDVAAIAVDDGFHLSGSAAVSQALAQARGAGIPTLSFEQRYPGSVWVSQSSPAQYADALADALASQMNRKGQYVIVPCRPAESIVQAELKAAKAYIPRRYPRMHRVGVVYGGIGNGPAGTLVLRPVLRKHQHLRGFIFLCPSESYTGPPQLAHAHEIGKVFSAGNGTNYPPLNVDYANSVLAGSAEMVCAGDPTHLGYLTIWAADYLATGHTLVPGAYDVGGPVGTVHYYSHDEELRFGRPVTITKANLDQYGISR